MSITPLLSSGGKICAQACWLGAQAQMNPQICLQYITSAAKNAHSQQIVHFVALRQRQAPDTMLSGIKVVPATGRQWSIA
ncbi:MAG: hypothetical protein E5W99_22950 [Mesorhizobium sp.]|nr:MAG: hypothetical protein E5W99_22950 [Mesorhizobium sp.]